MIQSPLQSQLRQQTSTDKPIIPQIVLSDEQLLESYQQQIQLENKILEFHGLDRQEEEKLLARHQDIEERLNVVNEGLKQMQAYELEMERLVMEREDKLSRDIEEFNHRRLFIQKDMKPPLLPPCLTAEDRPLRNKPVWPNPVPNAPMIDNFVKYKSQVIGVIPSKLDLSRVKILWSREKEQAEEEKQRQEELHKQREKEKKRLKDLLIFQAKKDSQCGKDNPVNSKQISEQLTKLIKTSTTLQCKNAPQKIKIEIKPQILGKDPQLYKSIDEIYTQHLVKQQKDLNSRLLKIIPSLEKSMPTLKENEDPKPLVIKQPKRRQSLSQQISMLQENFDDINNPLTQVLELHAPDPQKQDKLEIRNEEISSLDLKPLNSYKRLQYLNLSMNKIQTIHGSIDCPYLCHLRLSDNQIREIPPQLFQTCKNLKTLNLDINQLKSLQNLSHLSNLEELSIANNQLISMDGVQNLSKLRRLNLSFNKITSLDNQLKNLGLLEYLELGKNMISNIDQFPQHQMLFLSELYLYSNQLQNFPKSFSLPLLKILNLNRNQDLHQLQLGYNPLLETINASYCSLVSLKSLSGCPLITELDVSFNNLDKLQDFLEVLRFSKNLRSLRFSDNPLSHYDPLFNQLLGKLFPFIERINGENYERQTEQDLDFSHNSDLRILLSQLNEHSMIRQFVHKMMSQKIRVSFSSNTHIIKYYKNILPLIILKGITQDPKNQKSNALQLLSENFAYVERLREAVRIITSFMRRRRFKRKALLVKMKKHIKQVIKIQSLIKGHLTRVHNESLVKKIKRDGPKKTKKYQQISKLQANIKGFLFRKRRLKALRNLTKNKDEFDDLEEFNADQFFGIKKEVLEPGLSLPQEQMMQQMIQMMAVNNQQIVRKAPQQRLINSNVEDQGVKFPPINQKNMTSSNMNDVIKPRSMIQQQMVSTTGMRPPFNNARPPSARSNAAISEIDLNSDSQSVRNSNNPRGNSQVMNNNLIRDSQFNPHHMPSISGAQSRYNDDQSDMQSVYSMNSNPFYPSKVQSYKQKVGEEKKKEIIKTKEVIDEWGFQNEETKKMFEARLKRKNQGKKKVLTAEEKLLKFKAINEQTKRK